MTPNPWTMLAILCLARTSTGYMFQSIGSSAPAIAAGLAIDVAMIGTLIGLFKLPGIFLSIPAGLLARGASDRNLIGSGLALMGIGCALSAIGDGFTLVATGRFITGVGATVANLYFTKATLDWFGSHKSLPLAMSFLVVTWPIGIALGLMSQGAITLAYGWQASLTTSAALGLVAGLLVLFGYRDPPTRTVPPSFGWEAFAGMSRDEWLGIASAAIAWCFLNVGLALVFGFAPTILTTLGYDLARAGWLVSLGTWVGIVAIPIGGFIVSRYNNSLQLITVCTAAAIAVYAAMAQLPDNPWLYVAFGLAAFMPAGAIMAQPAVLTSPQNRAPAMGIFYTIYYLGMGLLPALAGALQLAAGTTAPLVLASVLMAISLGCVTILYRLAARRTASA